MQSAATSVNTFFSSRAPSGGNRSSFLAAATGRRRRRLPSQLLWSCQRQPRLQYRRRVSAVTTHDQYEVDDDRLSKNPCDFYPSVWGDFFIHHSADSAANSSHRQTRMVERVEELKKEVAKVIATSANCSLLERLNLIDAFERLCVDYLFETEINAALTEINNIDVSDCDLHTVAMWFYLLRKHGYKVPPDVFARFKVDEEGTFAANTPRELLSLYNAAHFRMQGEDILDQAISFTTKCLESKLAYLEGSLAHEIQCALEIPLPRRVAIYDAKYHITTYEEEATVNEMVLQLAKLNFNNMQLQYQKELKITTRWWTDLQIQTRLPFARDRLVECYLWMLGVYYEPSCSRGRIILTMVLSIVSILDDIYDSFGTLEECELFTQWVERVSPFGTQGFHRSSPQKKFNFLQDFEKKIQRCKQCLISYLLYMAVQDRNLVVDPKKRNLVVEFLKHGSFPDTCNLTVNFINEGCPVFSFLMDNLIEFFVTMLIEIFIILMHPWDPTAAYDLPECMRYVFGKIMDSYETIDNELAQEEKYRMSYLRNFTVDLVRNYNREVKMREEGYVPKSVEEHLQVSARTGACHLLACTSLVGMDHDVATKDSFDWVSTMPKMVHKLCIILRLLDDIRSYEREQMTPHAASTMDSYMQQHDVSIGTAREKILELKEEQWKDFNGEWLLLDNDDDQPPRKLLEAIFNLTRSMEFFYNQDDNYTYCRNLKDTVRSLFIHSFTIIV